MNDEIIPACYRFAGGLLVGILIGISWMDFRYPHASLPEAWFPTLKTPCAARVSFLPVIPSLIDNWTFWLVLLTCGCVVIPLVIFG